MEQRESTLIYLPSLQKKEARSDYKISQKCEHYLMSSMTPLLLHIPSRPSEHTHYIQLRRKAFNKLPASEQPGQGSRHAQSVGSEQSRHHHQEITIQQKSEMDVPV